MSNLIQLTAPTQEPVSLDELKRQLSSVSTEDDNFMSLKIAAAREQVERYECSTWMQLLTATFELQLDSFPDDDGIIYLPRPPLQSVQSVVYIDSAGDEQTFGMDESSPPAAVGYTVSQSTIRPAEMGEIIITSGYSWPTPRDQANAVRIRFTAGFGSTPSSVPAGIRNWILVIAATMCEHLEASVVGESISDFSYVDKLLDAYRHKVIV